MQHARVGLRALGEAVFWGTVGGGAYGLLLWVGFNGFDEGEGLFYLVLISALIGLMVGLTVGAAGAVLAGGLSLWGASDWAGRVVAGVTSAIGVGWLLWFFMDNDDDVVDFIVEAQDLWLFVVGPAALALVVGAWRAPAVLRAGADRDVRVRAEATE